MAKPIVEPYPDFAVVANPPYPIANSEEMDSWWDLPYMRAPHPRYKEKPIPAWEMIKFSVNIHRGCFGGCSFCTISAHQRKFIQSRSEKSIFKEIYEISQLPDFKGYITDLGGPSANMYKMKGIDLQICEKCKKPSCIFPAICKNLSHSHKPLLDLYRKAKSVEGVKKITIGSGVRYDLFANQSDENNRKYLEELLRFHVSGRLKVAPEHTDKDVLKLMRKPSFKLFEELKARFDSINRTYSLNQQIVPYFISSHPGCTQGHMKQLAELLEKLRIRPEQIQDFTPTPMTLASAIFYTGTDPYTGKKVFVERSKEGKIKQRDTFFWQNKKSLPKPTKRSVHPKKINK